jgi:hypothetical protein
MEYIEAPHEYHGDLPKVFLAGGIGNCSDWQAKAAADLAGADVALFNPRRVHFNTPWNRADSEEQIIWEFKALQAADIIVFWFDGGESAQPIALYELGRHTATRDKLLVIGCDPGYTRRDDVEIQLGLARPGLPVYDRLDRVCLEVRNLVNNLIR